MASIEMVGRNRLRGEINVQGSKNAVLPIMAAAILNKGTTVIENCPVILDVASMMRLMESIGCRMNLSGNQLTIDARYLTGNVIRDEYVRRLRASVLLMGAMLGREGDVTMGLPGGCSIGERPIDFHLAAFQAMSARLVESETSIRLSATGLRGVNIHLSFPSVGATENILLAAVRAEGRTVIHNAAREPEIYELCEFLGDMGAKVEGGGTGRIVVDGVEELYDVSFHMSSDRIVAGTYACAVAGVGGEVTLRGDLEAQMVGILPVLRQMGCRTSMGDGFLTVSSDGRPRGVSSVVTAPFPGFPTDMQSQVMTALCLAEQQRSIVMESIFNARFQVVDPLVAMGADIRIDGKKAQINGVKALCGSHVEAKELRGGAALTLAGLFAEGTTRVEGLRYIQRGYEDVVRDLTSLGADIRYVD